MPNKMLYLYIGMPKTGSSTVHYFLCKNNEILTKNGYIYPKMNAPCNCYTGVGFEYNNLHELYRRFLLHEIGTEEIEKVFIEEFCEQFNKNGCHSMILQSDEIFIGNRDLSFCDVFKKYGFDVKVIVYVRKPADYITSWWCELIKPYMPCPWAYTIEEAFKNIYVQYDLILDFIEKFGKDNVIVRPFDKKCFKNNDLIEDFLNILGLDLNDEYIKVKNQNVSFDRNITEIMLLIHMLKLPFDITEKLKYKIDFSKITKTKIVETLSDEFIKEITEKYIPVLDKIANIYGKEHLFDNYYPECYGKERPVFDKITISMKDLGIIHEAIETSLKIQNSKIEELNNIIKNKDSQIEELNNTIKIKDSQIEELNNIIKIKDSQIKQLSTENIKMHKSLGYKIGRETKRVLKQAKNVFSKRKV